MPASPLLWCISGVGWSLSRAAAVLFSRQACIAALDKDREHFLPSPRDGETSTARCGLEKASQPVGRVENA
jgi:hypothetical protein